MSSIVMVILSLKKKICGSALRKLSFESIAVPQYAVYCQVKTAGKERLLCETVRISQDRRHGGITGLS